MRAFMQEDRGTILVATATSVFCLLIFAALAIDISYILTAKNQLQSAVDASALAGASGLLVSHDMATFNAVRIGSQNLCVRTPVYIDPDRVTFPGSSRIAVAADRNINLFFAPIIGLNVATISATATAEISNLNGTTGLRPWAVPKENWQVGQEVVIKIGDPNDNNPNSFFYPCCFPAVNRGEPLTGGNVYEEALAQGTPYMVCIGDRLLVEPGNKVGPTQQGVNEILDLDPWAFWSGLGIVASRFDGFSSPRIIKIPLFDPAFPPGLGRDEITVVGLAAFFLEKIQGRDVIGIYLSITTSGEIGAGYSTLKRPRLVL